MRKFAAMLTVSAIFVACSGSDGGSGAVPLAQAPAELAKAYCQAERDCSPFYYSIGFANTDCAASLTKQLEQATFGQIQAAIEAKTVTYDAEQGGACARSIASSSCANLDNNTPESCQKAFAGTVASGGHCDIDQECAGLSHCVISGSVCPGVCAARASAGVACRKDGDCGLGLTCSPVTSHCAAPAAAGESCGGGVAGGCAAGLLCIGDDVATTRAGKCKTAAETLTQKAGETCDLQAGPLCEAGLSCIVDSASLNGPVSTCHEAAAPNGECGFGLPGQCPTGQACPITLVQILTGTYTAHCEALPPEGAACGSPLDFARCGAELVCDSTTAPLEPVCITPHGLGQSCSDDSLCYSKHCVGNTCVPETACPK